MFIAEKGIAGIEQVAVDLRANEHKTYAAGARFTIADITAFCALEFAHGLMKSMPGEEGMPHLQAYRGRIAERPSTT